MLNLCKIFFYVHKNLFPSKLGPLGKVGARYFLCATFITDILVKLIEKSYPENQCEKHREWNLVMY